MSPKRKPSSQLTRLELQIMQVLWRIGPGTVQEVQSSFPGEPLAYTTVQTMLNILHRKGRVKRKLIGKAYTYSSILSRETAVRDALVDVVDRMFGGSVEALVMSLLKTNQLDPKRLRELNELVSRRQQEDKDGDS
jgi:BlaI family penicillinase repressor